MRNKWKVENGKWKIAVEIRFANFQMMSPPLAHGCCVAQTVGATLCGRPLPLPPNKAMICVFGKSSNLACCEDVGCDPWSAVQIFDLGNSTHVTATEIYDFECRHGCGRPLPLPQNETHHGRGGFHIRPLVWLYDTHM